MRKIKFGAFAYKDFQEFKIKNRKLYYKIVLLLKSIKENPFIGIGKPEPLKHEFQGLWSRRINLEHRLIYRITESEIIIISCKYHY